MLTLTVVAVIALIVGLGIGRFFAPTPVPAVQETPRPKRFGLDEAEVVKEKLGGMTAAQAQVVQVAAVVGGMEFVLATDVKKTRDGLASAIATQRGQIEAMRAAIKDTEVSVANNQARDAEVGGLAAAFGI